MNMVARTAVLASGALFVWIGSMAPLAAAASSVQATDRTGITAGPQLARVYDAIFDARFDEVPQLLTQTCSTGETHPDRRGERAPAETCQLLEVVSLWWQIQLDPNGRSLDPAFGRRVDQTIEAIDAWTRREPERAEAWFYLGGAYGARAQWRVLRAERLAAARDGKRIKDALERALALDGNLQDAFFGIGLYHYYADVAPAAAKVLRWLLLLPGGNKSEGMQEMLRARNGGQLLRSEADYQLHVIYLWYEKQPERALDLLQELHDRHPRNPLFQQLIAEVEDVYLHDLTASLRSWEALLAAARARRVAEPMLAETRARLGIALQLDRLHQTDAALPHLRAVVDLQPTAPYSAYAEAQLQLGQALDRLGQRSEAVAAYRAALAATPAGDVLKIGPRARAGLREAPSASTASAYRLSIDGWRALERGALTESARLLAQSLALRPDDQVTRYRQAHLLQAQKNDTAALSTLDGIIRARNETPPTFYASACVDAARLYERQGDPGRAIDLYRTARTVFGADQRTREAAERALARLTGAPARSSR